MTTISSSLSLYNICMGKEFIVFQKQCPQNIKNCANHKLEYLNNRAALLDNNITQDFCFCANGTERDRGEGIKEARTRIISSYAYIIFYRQAISVSGLPCPRCPLSVPCSIPVELLRKYICTNHSKTCNTCHKQREIDMHDNK